MKPEGNGSSPYPGDGRRKPPLERSLAKSSGPSGRSLDSGASGGSNRSESGRILVSRESRGLSLMDDLEDLAPREALEEHASFAPNMEKPSTVWDDDLSDLHGSTADLEGSIADFGGSAADFGGGFEDVEDLRRLAVESEERRKPGATRLIHFDHLGNFQLECSATVQECRVLGKAPGVGGDGDHDKEETEVGPGRDLCVEIQLDVTNFHPQGGGQPSDVGTVTCGDVTASITKVTIDRATGFVIHEGTVKLPPDVSELALALGVGAKVKCKVDAENRRLLSECHTAGHVVDAAMSRCGMTLPPTKGYHFLDGPYVEYKGSVPPEQKDALLQSLQAAFGDLIDEDIETTIETLPLDVADKVCNRTAKNFEMSDFSDGGDVRVVTVAGWASPCGGTHVKTTIDLKERKWGVKGLRSKKGVVRVRYGPDVGN